MASSPFRLLILVAAILSLANIASAGDLGSNWHPDPDGDGVPSLVDLCANVYDPAQLDGDLDGLGNACDPDFAPPSPGGAITDLHVEHVTPAGAWLGMTSPHDRQWGWTVVTAWSTDANELTTLVGFKAANSRGDAISTTVSARFGEAALRPVMLTGLAPDTTYYAAATEGAWDGFVDQLSPVIELHTLTALAPTLSANRPRVLTTPAHISQLRSFRSAGDAGWTSWAAAMRPTTHQAAVDPPSVYLSRHYCTSAALLHLVSDNPTDLADAIVLLDQNITYWEASDLDANLYRWEDAQLGLCLDLLWDKLNLTTRNRAVAAFLSDDELHVAGGFPRIEDTDEFASTVRTWLIDGLTACSATGIDPALASRACAVLDEGLNLWQGVQLVRTRRDRGFWAQSGGFLPDGTDYGQGTARYWLQSFLVLANAGVPSNEWAPFIRYNLVSMVLQQLTPTRLGFFTAGDIDDIIFNILVEPNSFGLEQADAALLLLSAGTLDAAGDPTAAAWARFLGDDLYPVDDSEDGIYHLLFGASALPAVDHRNELALTHFDSGNGLFVDRTSWSEAASMLFVRAGWNGVDHSHGDVGHFQLFRRGRWITHEAVGYDGPASMGDGHNVLLLQSPDEGNLTPATQDRFPPSLNRVSRASSGSFHSALVMDLSGAYTPYTEPERYHDAVQRSLLWIKSDESGSRDVLVVLDLARHSATAPAGLQGRWQLHLDEAPSINGRTASVNLPAATPQRVDIDVLLPADATLTPLIPEGIADTYPGQLYNHRLMVDSASDPIDQRFFVVIQAADSGSPAVATSLLTVTGLSGAMIGDDIVLLPTEPLSGDTDGATAFTASAPTTSAVRVFAAGLEPGQSFTVVASQNSGDLTVEATAGGPLVADSGGVLAFTVDASRTVTALYAVPIFSDGFESADVAAWSSTSP